MPSTQSPFPDGRNCVSTGASVPQVAAGVGALGAEEELELLVVEVVLVVEVWVVPLLLVLGGFLQQIRLVPGLPQLPTPAVWPFAQELD